MMPTRSAPPSIIVNGSHSDENFFSRSSFFFSRVRMSTKRPTRPSSSTS